MQISCGMRATRIYRFAFAWGAVLTMVGCSSVSHHDSTSKTDSVVAPPEFAAACPIKQSAIDSLVVKTTGLAYNGTQFGNVGTYTYMLAEAKGTVKAGDPCARTIVDLRNAADGTGTVKYSFDVVILTPTDPAKANGTLLYEVVNRGRTIALAALQDSNTMDIYNAVKPVMPSEAKGVVRGKGAGNAFLLNQGYTIVLSGWQGDRPQRFSIDRPAAITDKNKWPVIGMTVPVARDVANGNAPITGKVQDEFIADKPKANLLGTYYKRVPGTPATLTIRKTPNSSPIVVAETLWKYVPGAGTAEAGNTGPNGLGHVAIDRASLRADARYAAALDDGSDNGSIYLFDYTAVDPKVLGLGFLATRDLISFLRYETKDASGNVNPLVTRPAIAVATGISQSGRYLRDFLWQGFNEDAKGRSVFDGMLTLVGGSRKTYTNYRWAKPGDYSRQQETHYAPGDQFPFAYATITDPLTGKSDGLLKKCTQTRTCPKVYQYDSPIEANGGRTSLLVTDGAGKAIPVPDNVRLFYAPGTQHTPLPATEAADLQPDYTVDRSVGKDDPSANPWALVSSTAMYRALFMNLEGWVKGTAKPLDNRYPSVSDGTLAVATPNPASTGRPDLAAAGLPYNGGYNTLSVNDESVSPPVPGDRYYVVPQPTTDAQGNERAGVKMPDIAVPLATFAGYNLRKKGFVEGQQNGLNSSQLAFPTTPATRKVGDPRKSLLELYGSKAAYLDAVNRAVDQLVAEGFILAPGVGGVDDPAEYRNRAQMQVKQAGFQQLP